MSQALKHLVIVLPTLSEHGFILIKKKLIKIDSQLKRRGAVQLAKLYANVSFKSGKADYLLIVRSY